MARRMQDLESTVADIEHVAVRQPAGYWYGRSTERRHVKGLARHGADEHVWHVCADRRELVEQRLRIRIGRERHVVRRLLNHVAVVAVRAAVLELAEPAVVVEMRVGGDPDNRPVETIAKFGAERTDPEACVHDQQPRAAADQPRIGADVGVHEWLGNAQDAVADLAHVKPPLRNWEALLRLERHLLSSSARDPAPGAGPPDCPSWPPTAQSLVPSRRPRLAGEGLARPANRPGRACSLQGGWPVFAE